jgi:hypothetical protein
MSEFNPSESQRQPLSANEACRILFQGEPTPEDVEHLNTLVEKAVIAGNMLADPAFVEAHRSRGATEEAFDAAMADSGFGEVVDNFVNYDAEYEETLTGDAHEQYLSELAQRQEEVLRAFADYAGIPQITHQGFDQLHPA